MSEITVFTCPHGNSGCPQCVEEIYRLRAENAILAAVVDQIDAQGYWSGKYNSNAALVRILDEYKNIAKSAKDQMAKMRGER